MVNQLSYFQQKYRIPSIRLKHWDYSSSGWYFITICTYQKTCYFGEIINGKMELSEIGKIAEKYWLEIPKHFSNIRLDEFVIMPNHIHGIIVIEYKIHEINTLTITSSAMKNLLTKFANTSKTTR